ncbi:MAG: SpoIIE family protein phosphatase [Oscillospiraceae bacterium]|nr:SpoIIE family protein phosphatase [Oscillospiraceae bacterium]
MIMSIGTYVRRGRRFIRRWTSDPKLRAVVKGAGFMLCGFVLSAASLGNSPQPLSLAFLCAGLGLWQSLLVALGSTVGYYLLWGVAGTQGIIWTGAGLVICFALGGQKISRQMPLLMPALAGLSVAATGLMFQLLQAETTPIAMYFLRIALAIGAARIFASVLERRDPVMDWLALGLGVLSLCQTVPLAAINPGYIAAGALGAAAPFPAAALAGLALDLSQITNVPMAAVLSLAFLVRLVPGLPKWTAHAAPCAMYLLTAMLHGNGDWTPAIALALGGLLGVFLPAPATIAHRRGETGIAQVRLEMTAGVLAQTEQLLLETPEYPIDEPALIYKAADRACSACPCRESCRESAAATRLPTSLLHRPLITVEDLPIKCRKRGRLLLELRRMQDQYRSIRADRDRRREYRSALTQQYRFLSEYLQDLADRLPKRGDVLHQRYEPMVGVCSAGQESANGDRCVWFAGTECRYYVLLCDGMGTGFGAAEEGRAAAEVLRRLLSAGFPAEYALRSLNSLCTLRERAGAVTVDLAEIDLQNGKVNLYKWGAAPSYLLTPAGPEKIGTAAAPPGLSVTGTRETVDKLSLRRGETLILLSDGIDGEAAMRRAWDLTDKVPGEMASKVLQYGRGNGCDDATAAVIRLSPATLST